MGDGPLVISDDVQVFSWTEKGWDGEQEFLATASQTVHMIVTMVLPGMVATVLPRVYNTREEDY